METNGDDKKDFGKEIYDRLTKIFTEQGFQYRGNEHAYDLLTEVRASLESGYEDWDWVHSSAFVGDLVSCIEALVFDIHVRTYGGRYAVIAGAFDESGCDRCGPEASFMKTFPSTPDGLKACMDEYLKQAYSLRDDCKANEEFHSSHDIESSDIWNVSLSDEIRCGRVNRETGLHTGFAMIKEVEDV